MLHYSGMKSSSPRNPWSSYRTYVIGCGLAGTLLSDFAVTLQSQPQPMSHYLIGSVAAAGIYTAATALSLGKKEATGSIDVVAVVDVAVLGVVSILAHEHGTAALYSMYGLVTLLSMATNASVGFVGAALASLLLLGARFFTGGAVQPVRMICDAFLPVGLFFILGSAGAALRQYLLSGVSREAAEHRDRAIEEYQKNARHLLLEKEKRERDLSDKKQQLYALLSVSQYLSSTRNTKDLLQAMCRRAREDMNCAASFVMLVEERDLRLVHSVGITEMTQRLMDCKVGEGLLGEVVASNKVVRLSEKDADPRLRAFKQNWESFRNVLLVPLTTSQDPTPFGLIGVANLLVGEEFLLDAHEDYLKILAASSAIAIKNISLTENLEQSYHEIIHALAQAIEAKDPYTHGHIGRVQEYATSLAQALKLSEAEVRTIAKGAILHDVGKISTPNEILNKPGALTPAERKKMDDHVTSSIHILKDIKSLPPEVFEMVLYHHERFDGKGYPYGLSGDEIPIGAQVISVVDAFDAMTTDRPYRKGFPQEKALDLLAISSGSQFSPRVLQAFFSLFNFKPRTSNGGGPLELGKAERK
ncbi:MAG: HD domain-containing protein [Proteobacteria bacterium]|nr:HD domain-containing protein [Pseudomonadota bacterium]